MMNTHTGNFDKLKRIIDNRWIKRVMVENDDLTVLITGETGAGKSALALQIAKYICEQNKLDFSVANNVHYTLDNFISSVEMSPPGSVQIMDEAILLAYSSNAATKGAKSLTQLINICRSQNQILLIILPDFFDIMKSVRNRSIVTLHVKKINARRGYFTMYSRKMGEYHLIQRDKKLDISTYRNPKFKDRFLDPQKTIPKLWEQYENKKDRDAINEIRGQLPKRDVETEWIRTKEAATLVNRKVPTIRKLIYDKHIRGKKRGHFVYINKNELLEYYGW